MSSKELINVAEKERNSGVVENDDLGSAAFATLGTGAGEVPTNDDLDVKFAQALTSNQTYTVGLVGDYLTIKEAVDDIISNYIIRDNVIVTIQIQDGSAFDVSGGTVFEDYDLSRFHFSNAGTVTIDNAGVYATWGALEFYRCNLPKMNLNLEVDGSGISCGIYIERCETPLHESVITLTSSNGAENTFYSYGSTLNDTSITLSGTGGYFDASLSTMRNISITSDVGVDIKFNSDVIASNITVNGDSTAATLRVQESQLVCNNITYSYADLVSIPSSGNIQIGAISGSSRVTVMDSLTINTEANMTSPPVVIAGGSYFSVRLYTLEATPAYSDTILVKSGGNYLSAPTSMTGQLDGQAANSMTHNSFNSGKIIVVGE